MLSKVTGFYPKNCPAKGLTNLHIFLRINFLHSNQIWNRFQNPFIKGFEEFNLKIGHYFKMLDFFCSCKLYISEEKIFQVIKQFSDFSYVTVPSFCVSLTYTGPNSVPGSRGSSFEVLCLNACIQFHGKAKKM